MKNIPGSSVTKPMSLTQVPYEVLRHLFSYLAVEELVAITHVSKHFSVCVDEKPTVIPRKIAYISLPHLVWGLKTGLELSKINPYFVIKAGNLEVFQLLVRVVPWELNVHMLRMARGYGHLDIVEFIAPMVKDPLLDWARKNDSLEVLRALRDGSLGGVCPWV